MEKARLTRTSALGVRSPVRRRRSNRVFPLPTPDVEVVCLPSPREGRSGPPAPQTARRFGGERPANFSRDRSAGPGGGGRLFPGAASPCSRMRVAGRPRTASGGLRRSEARASAVLWESEERCRGDCGPGTGSTPGGQGTRKALDLAVGEATVAVLGTRQGSAGRDPALSGDQGDPGG